MKKYLVKGGYMKLKIQDVLKLDKLDLRETQDLLYLLDELSKNPKTVFEITKVSIESDIALSMLKRKWLCRFTINGCQIEPKKKGFLINSCENIRSKSLSFRDHEILPSVAHYREEDFCLSVFDKNELFYCLAMSEIEVPKAIIEYMGIRSIFGYTRNFVNKLNITIQTIGPGLFD
jgi:hypothetical protein